MAGRRLSKLTLTPLALSALAWASLVGVMVALPRAASALEWLILAWLVTVGLSVAAAVTGGAAFVRVQLRQWEMRGRGVALTGCATGLIAGAVVLGPPLIFGLVLLWVGSDMPAHPIPYRY